MLLPIVLTMLFHITFLLKMYLQIRYLRFSDISSWLSANICKTCRSFPAFFLAGVSRCLPICTRSSTVFITFEDLSLRRQSSVKSLSSTRAEDSTLRIGMMLDELMNDSQNLNSNNYFNEFSWVSRCVFFLP